MFSSSRSPSSPANMADVARAAGVSRATVSRVLSRTVQVSPGVRERVLRAVDELGYVPSVHAQQLAAGRSNTVGLLIRDSRNSSYGLLYSQVQQWAEELGLNVVTAMPTHYRQQGSELEALRRLLSMRVGGLLVATGVVRTHDLLPLLSKVPIISVGRPESHPQVYGVSYDEADNARQIAQLIYARGHRKVAVVCPLNEHSLAENMRANVATEQLRKLGCIVEVIPVARFAAMGQGHEEIFTLLSAKSISAVMFPSDARMVQFAEDARKAGINVPADVSLIGCDGTMPGLDYMQLATLRIPVETVARRSVEVISQMLRDRDSVTVQHEKFTGELRPAASLASL
ncbi:LacI family transcriptional regulator [Dermabacteraceae bacterium TAE3-ERU27]|nr:LacI family transcriptional regulator [Dermabacteraceae bacterium TAE3-ERU27]